MAEYILDSPTERFPDIFGHIFVKTGEIYLWGRFYVKIKKSKNIGGNKMENMKIRYLETLAELYPTIAQASTEIINLQAILNLPKGTEHFLTDIHGEYEAFAHVLKNGSGSVRRKIKQVFGHT